MHSLKQKESNLITEFGIVTLIKFLQPLKAFFSIILIVGGIEIVVNCKLYINKFIPIFIPGFDNKKLTR